MSNTELAKHIYFYSQSCKNELPPGHIWTEKDDRTAINYIANLIELHFEPQNHLGSKGFLSISKDIRSEFGC
jgi:hypothetical protein